VEFVKKVSAICRGRLLHEHDDAGQFILMDFMRRKRAGLLTTSLGRERRRESPAIFGTHEEKTLASCAT